MPRSRLTVTHVAWGLAILTSVVTVLMGPITQALFTDPRHAEPFHYIATYIMLGTIVFLMVVLSSTRRIVREPVTIQAVGDRLVLQPCGPGQTLRWGQEELDGALHRIAQGQRLGNQWSSIVFFSLDDVDIPSGVEKLWPYLPAMRVLSVQRSSLPQAFWTGLERCEALDHVLASDAKDNALAKEIYMTVPEIKVHANEVSVSLQT